MVDLTTEPPDLKDFMGRPLHFIYYIRDKERHVKGIELITDTGMKISIGSKAKDGSLNDIIVEKDVG